MKPKADMPMPPVRPALMKVLLETSIRSSVERTVMDVSVAEILADFGVDWRLVCLQEVRSLAERQCARTEIQDWDTV